MAVGRIHHLLNPGHWVRVFPDQMGSDEAGHRLHPFGVGDHVVFTSGRKLTTVLQTPVCVDHHDAGTGDLSPVARALSIEAVQVRQQCPVEADAGDL